MTVQPPPGARSGPAFDPKSVHPLDWTIMGIGFLIFIFSFFGYYRWSLGPFGSYSASAWHFGGGTFIAWFAMVAALLGTAGTAMALFVPTLKLALPSRVVGLGLFAGSVVLYLIAIFAHSSFGPNGGHGFSFWLSLLLAIGGAVVSLMRVQQTGQQLPGALDRLPNIGAYGSAKKTGDPRPSTGDPSADS